MVCGAGMAVFDLAEWSLSITPHHPEASLTIINCQQHLYRVNNKPEQASRKHSAFIKVRATQPKHCSLLATWSYAGYCRIVGNTATWKISFNGR